jgi:hypothetical protein
MEKSMSHIPEDELHAYLDQALGRLRCVEIESHLAECTRCRDVRDGIAALRDRTTALLARLAPRRTTIPPYADIRRRAQIRAFRQQRILARVAWAASVVLALGIGWTANTLYRPPSTPAPLASAPLAPPVTAVPDAAAPDPAVPADVAPAPAPTPRQRVSAPAPTLSTPRRRLAAAPAVSGPASERPVADAWRSVAWNGAPRGVNAPAGAAAAAPAADSSSTVAGVVVTRQLGAGEVVRAVGGSQADVASLLSGRPAEPETKPAAPAMPPAYSSGVLALRQGPGAGPSAVPSDSLRAMMHRLNLMLRVR